ncbi:MAG: efflux RND transporter periplasmic adaptor subunit [Oscillospiraceae bacterium]|nr:efflux RND transporter periplasmic adaptor subunit [Oscillospiraceae bacterium]
MRRRWTALLLAALVLLSLAGCGDSTAVYVQSVEALSDLGGIAPGDRFAGVVVSEHVAEVKKDGDKTIAELYVREGDDVTEGQLLFSYDTAELQLSLDRLILEQSQLEAAIANYTEQIADLEEDLLYAYAGDELEYTVQIQTLQVDLQEAELNLAAKKTEVEQAQALLANADVVSPVTGRVQAIDDDGMDAYGNPAAYITIQKSGAYRVKGTIGELQRGGIIEGTRIRVISRTDEALCWYGTVTLVDYENPSQGNEYAMYYGMEADEMTSSSKYPFYVELEDTEGLILGQHVYLEVDTGEEAAGLKLNAAFVCFDEDGSAYVWAEKRAKLEKRGVTVGEYDFMNDTYPILEGLTEEDFIAFPDEELCHEGAPTTHTEAAESETVFAEEEVG